MGIFDLVRTLPRGVRPPGPVIGEETTQESFILTQDMWNAGMLPPLANTGWQVPAVTNDMLRGIPAAWYANNMIAGTIAQMRLDDIDDKTNEAADPPPVVLTRPWPIMTYFDFIYMGITQAVNAGNFYAIKHDFDDATLKPRQLLPVGADDMVVEVIKGIPYYTVVPIDKTFSWDDIFHVRGLCIPGRVTGIGVIEAHRKGLRDIRTLMDYGNNSYTGGGVPPVVLTVDKPELAEGEAEYLQTRWMARHAGGNRVPAVVPKIVSVDAMGMSMVDSDYLNSRKFSVAEIAFMYGINPEFLTVSLGGSHVTYANVETKNREALIYSLQPWMSRYEQACYDLVPGPRTVKFKPDALLRAAEEDRVKMYSQGLDAGIYTLNEVRKREGLKPYDKWADEPFGTPPPPPVEPSSRIPQELSAQPGAAPTVAGADGQQPPADASTKLDALMLNGSKA